MVTASAHAIVRNNPGNASGSTASGLEKSQEKLKSEENLSEHSLNNTNSNPYSSTIADSSDPIYSNQESTYSNVFVEEEAIYSNEPTAILLPLRNEVLHQQRGNNLNPSQQVQFDLFDPMKNN